jgi:UDP-N-acetylglucosamine 3-dehydrogenase
LSEKPLSDSTEGIDELAALAAAADKKVMVAHCFRYHEGLLKAKEMLDAGGVGQLVSVRALMGEHLPDVRPDYRSLLLGQYLGAFDLTHDIDLAIWFAGLPVKQVHALSGAYSDIGINSPDIAEILLGFEGRDVLDTVSGNSVRRCLATIHLDLFQRPRRRQIELIGTGGVIIVEFASWDRCTVSVYQVSTANWEHQELITDRDDMFRAEDREFLEAIAEDKPIRCTIAEGRKAVEVVVAATQGIT